MFGGSGSFGNGAAMRVAPLGAFFADDLDDLVEAAARSARVTHAHPEGVAGAIAVALAAALAYRGSLTGKLGPKALFSAVLERTPESVTRARIEEASRLAPTTSIPDAAYLLGSGDQVSAQDTVPFVLWSAAHHLGNYEAAFWATVEGLGDRDTTAAMVGGIVALSSRSVPSSWIAAREPLPPEFLDA